MSNESAVVIRESEKVMSARCRLMTLEPWYGTFAMNMDWIPSDMRNHSMKTMGVRVVNGGRIECIYYPPFVESLTIEQLYGVIQHEIEHVVRLHCVRRDSMQNPIIWNIAADMCVNGTKDNPRIGFVDGVKNGRNVVITPIEKMVYIDPKFPENDTTEVYYKLLIKDIKEKSKNQKCETCNGTGKTKDCPHCGGTGKEPDSKDESSDGEPCSQCNGSGQQPGSKGGSKSEKDCPDCGGTGLGGNPIILQGEDADGLEDHGYGKHFDNHEVWKESNTSPEETRQVVKDICDQATQRNMGNYPGHLQQAIENLNKPIVSWSKILRGFIGRHCGKKRDTWARRSRRHNRFGMKGVSRHAASKFLVVIDTSGSVSDKMLKQFFTEIEDISHQAIVGVLQWDHDFQGYKQEYQKGDWKKIKCNGRGGTDMVAPIEYAKKNGIVGEAVIMLTDGECHWPEKQEFPTIFVTMNNRKVDGPDWGIHVHVDPEVDSRW